MGHQFSLEPVAKSNETFQSSMINAFFYLTLCNVTFRTLTMYCSNHPNRNPTFQTEESDSIVLKDGNQPEGGEMNK